jgi:hypothetical protein
MQCCMVEGVKEVEKDSWAIFKTRRSTACAKQLLAARWRTWRLGRRRRDVEGRGEGQRGVVSGGRGRWRARGAERSGAVATGAQETAGEGGGVTGAERNRGREGWR